MTPKTIGSRSRKTAGKRKAELSDRKNKAEPPKPPTSRTPEEQALINKFKASRRIEAPPRIRVEKDDNGTLIVTPEGDFDLEVAKMAKAFGIDDWLAGQLVAYNLAEAATPLKSGDYAKSSNGAFALVHGIAPRDTVEGLLAAQMVATHVAAMEHLRRLAIEQKSVEIYDSIANRATKLLRTFTAQVEALNRHRNAGKQVITVNHIGQVNAETAAIAVGCMTGGTGGDIKIQERPHVTSADQQLTCRPEEDMRSQGETQRQTVPPAANGERQVLPSRRGEPRRSARSGELELSARPVYEGSDS